MSSARKSQRRRATTRAAEPDSPQGVSFVYWLVPVVLSSILWWLSELSTHQIRYEELAESVRSVFWLDHRFVYDGVYSNIGWYGTLLLVYKIFGFSLFTAKWVRLAIHLTGLCAAAEILRRAMGWRAAIVPLVLVGLSPALLYFGTLQTSYGLDLPYAAICLLLVLSIRPGSMAVRDLALTFLCGVVAAVAATSYPTFLFYLPSLVLVAIWRIRRSPQPDAAVSGRWIGRHVAAAGAGLALPLAAMFLLVRTPGLLIYDPATHAGLFRGGGEIGFHPALLRESVLAVLGDLFVRGRSYYFEVSRPDFSGLLALCGLCSVAATSVYLFITRKADRTILAATALLLLVTLAVPSLSSAGPPGLRRCTGLLAVYFILFALTWRFYLVTPLTNPGLRVAGIVLCLLLPLDSALKLPSLAADAASDSIYRNVDWFAIQPTPTEALNTLLSNLDRGQKLSCPMNFEGKIVPCRYQEVYSAMAGYREWNRRGDVDIQALDWKTGQEITLSPTLWASRYYPTCTRAESCR